MTDDNSDLREQLAALCHQQWSGWMEHLFRLCQSHAHAVAPKIGPWERAIPIPRQLAERWKKQIATLYADLSEAEKESDRAEADRILEVVRASLTAVSRSNRELQIQIGLIEAEATEPQPTIKFYDDPTQYAREMAARLAVSRDVYKHKFREAEAQLTVLSQAASVALELLSRMDAVEDSQRFTTEIAMLSMALRAEETNKEGASQPLRAND